MRFHTCCGKLMNFMHTGVEVGEWRGSSAPKTRLHSHFVGEILNGISKIRVKHFKSYARECPYATGSGFPFDPEMLILTYRKKLTINSRTKPHLRLLPLKQFFILYIYLCNPQFKSDKTFVTEKANKKISLFEVASLRFTMDQIITGLSQLQLQPNLKLELDIYN